MTGTSIYKAWERLLLRVLEEGEDEPGTYMMKMHSLHQ
jgi:hypothetical protein